MLFNYIWWLVEITVMRVNAAVADFGFPSATILKPVLLAVKPAVFAFFLELSRVHVVTTGGERETLQTFMVKLNYRASTESPM